MFLPSSAPQPELGVGGLRYGASRALTLTATDPQDDKDFHAAGKSGGGGQTQRPGLEVLHYGRKRELAEGKRCAIKGPSREPFG
jgi:hypothetical protein